ncbi:MAG TPA: hypothetical protein VJ826_10000 [Candidatus Polarisedimenticolaceae bacterium]|nr:hypothetical protein [Candidatus Polarisedimenticolaceae bacterium]
MADVAAPKPKKDLWDKVAVFFHPLGGLLTALSVAYVGMRGSDVLERRQAEDTRSRLYAELMSRREEAETSLRKDMLTSIISSFFAPASANDIDTKVLNLELLAYNFHDSLDLRPLFLDLQRRIRRSNDPDKHELTARVENVAREITAKQLFSLEGHGKSFRRSVDMEELEKAGKAGIALEPEPVKIDGDSCEINLRVLSVEKADKQLIVRLTVKAPEGRPELPDTRATFDVSYFDFPMIDNTRLANGIRCAVTLSNYSDFAADLTTVCFPGEYASLKEKPYYDEVIQKLNTSTSEAGAPPAAKTYVAPQ